LSAAASGTSRMTSGVANRGTSSGTLLTAPAYSRTEAEGIGQLAHEGHACGAGLTHYFCTAGFDLVIVNVHDNVACDAGGTTSLNPGAAS
jgi:hypothetical protein